MAHVSSTTAGTITAATFSAPEADRPARDVALEVPVQGSTLSGIGLISGWSCLGGNLEAEISDANGVIARVPLPHGSSRADTESACGDARNGFSAAMNWTLLGSGEKTIRLMQNGEAVASRDFSVVAFETEFLRGASGMCRVDDFPGRRTRVSQSSGTSLSRVSWSPRYANTRSPSAGPWHRAAVGPEAVAPAPAPIRPASQARTHASRQSSSPTCARR